MKKKPAQFFEIILNGQQTRYNWLDTENFNTANTQKPALFGKKAMEAGEAPIKVVFTFKDGNIVGFRGDKFPQPNYIEMVRNLYNLAKNYWADKKVHEIIMYDNRKILPDNMKVILHWREDKSTLINLLPIYSGSFDVKQKQAK